MTQLRKVMLEELQRRDHSQTTVSSYDKTVADFAKYFRQPPDQLGPDDIRTFNYICSTIESRAPRTIRDHIAALRFYFCRTLKRIDPLEEVPYPRAIFSLWRLHALQRFTAAELKSRSALNESRGAANSTHAFASTVVCQTGRGRRNALAFKGTIYTDPAIRLKPPIRLITPDHFRLSSHVTHG